MIVGGGLAGLSAAASLAERGLAVALLESRPRLGGRASSFQDPTSGEPVDNCQHVSMACCTNLAAFCRRVGADGLFRRERSLTFLGPDGRLSRLAAGPWPAPMHLAGSFLRANYLTWAEKARVAYGLARLARERGPDTEEPFAEWLLRNGQTIRTINLYWSTVLVSALNERLDRMDVGHARKVFVDGFLRNRDGFRMEVPLEPLGELFGRRMEAWLASRGVEVRLTSGVRNATFDEAGRVAGVLTRTGEALPADFLILAVPFDRVGALIPPGLADQLPALAAAGRLEPAPITGIHLWFDRPICPHDHVVMPGRIIQWVFNHTAIQGRSAGEAGQYLQLVVSASYDLLHLDKHAIRDLAVGELGEIWPAAGEARLLRWWVVTEHGATFGVRPGVEAIRPAQRTPIPGLFLAGDWTATGWPATMEGAVRSGLHAAEGILQDLGRSERLVEPGLPTGWLARRFLGPGPDEVRVPAKDQLATGRAHTPSRPPAVVGG